MKEKKVIVSLKGISKTYDNDVKVVKNIDLDIYEGEFLTILGASGCGKTTTLRMIAGFEDVSSGDICIDGSSVIGVPPYKRQVNVMPSFFCIVFNSSCICFLRLRSRAPNGSSSNNTFGLLMSSLAIDTRCFCPPES